MTPSAVSKIQQIEDGWRAEQLAVFREQKQKKEAEKANERTIERRLALLEAEVQLLKEKIEGAVKS